MRPSISLPQAPNGRFAAVILEPPVPGFGRLASDAIAIAREFTFTKDAARGENNTLLTVRSNASHLSSHLAQVDLL